MEETERIMKFKSVEKLRHHAHVLKGGSTDYNELFEIADEIEAEVSLRYMRRPANVFDEVIGINDMVNTFDKRELLVNSMIWDGKRWYISDVIASSDWLDARFCHLTKPRTVENVLEEFADSYYRNVRNRVEPSAELVRKCAAEIRELLGVEG